MVPGRSPTLKKDDPLTTTLCFQFKQLMIKLDPEEEADDDENPSSKTPQKSQMPPPNTSQAYPNEVTLNHQHMNNVQINLPRVNLPMSVDPPQNFVSFRQDARVAVDFNSNLILRKSQST